MKTRVQKWGNSLALRIPKSFATEVNLGCNSEVELSIKGGDLVVSPTTRRRYTLRELVDGITDENRHDEISTGPSVGNEIW